MQIFCFYQCYKSTSALAQHQSTYIQRNSFSSFLLSVKVGKREIFCARRISEGSEVSGKMLATLTLLNLAAMVRWFFVSLVHLIGNFINVTIFCFCLGPVQRQNVPPSEGSMNQGVMPWELVNDLHI